MEDREQTTDTEKEDQTERNPVREFENPDGELVLKPRGAALYFLKECRERLERCEKATDNLKKEILQVRSILEVFPSN